MNISVILLVALASGGGGLLYALGLMAVGSRGGCEQTRRVAKTIQGGALAFLKWEYVAMALVLIPVAFGLTYLGQWTANGFITGALGSVLVGHISVALSLQANARTVEAAGQGIGPALRVAFRGGAAAGLAAAGVALLAVAGYYTLARAAVPADEAFRALLGLSLGAVLAGLFLRLAGGLYANAAEAGADVADQSDPALIARTVASHTSESIGLATDLYESYALTLVAAMLLARHAFGSDSPWVEFPLLVGSIALAGTFIGGFFVRMGKRRRSLGALYRGIFVAALLTGGGFYAAAEWFLALPGLESAFGPYGLLATLLTGIALAGIILLIAEYQTQAGFKPVKRIAAASQGGQAANLFAGLSAGQKSVVLPVLVALAALGLAYSLGGGFSANPWMGLYAVALAALAALSLGGTAVALSTYATIIGNARSIAEVAGLYALKRSVADPLNAAGNTAKGIAKAYATLSAGLAALVLFAEFSTTLEGSADYALGNPPVLVGLLAGGLLAHWLSARLLSAIGLGGERVRAEAQRHADLAEDGSQPAPNRCAEIASRNAIRQTVVPVLILLATPVAIGLLLGKGALAGFLFGSVAAGLLQSLAATSSGSALSNARRHIEAGSFGGNRSLAHEAAVSGEAIGSPLGTTVGPAAASLGKLAGVVALLLVPLLSA